MAKRQPKKYLNPTMGSRPQFGDDVRHGYVKTITENAPAIPKPVEYADIDAAVKEFVDKNINMKGANGKSVPVFTLYSNQRFSEYSQSWNHTDEDGNLLMNFKTLNRDTNPKEGDNQTGLWNIPGERFYTFLIRTVLDDNGEESYEVYSMKQPFAVDLTYRVNIVTNLMENINNFNVVINNLFKSRQFYIRPNGHWMPIVLEDISDDSKYDINGQKFYVQSATFKVMAYIIQADDIKVERKPKRINVFMEGDSLRKPKINIDEWDAPEKIFRTADISVDIEPWNTKVNFDFDTDMVVEHITSKNLRSLRIFVNGEPIFYEKGFNIKADDNIRLYIKQYDPQKPSNITLSGYYPDQYVMSDAEKAPENASEEADELQNDYVTVEK